MGISSYSSHYYSCRLYSWGELSIVLFPGAACIDSEETRRASSQGGGFQVCSSLISLGLCPKCMPSSVLGSNSSSSGKQLSNSLSYLRSLLLYCPSKNVPTAFLSPLKSPCALPLPSLGIPNPMIPFDFPCFCHPRVYTRDLKISFFLLFFFFAFLCFCGSFVVLF